MNHYINLLEPSECVYPGSAAQAAPALKLGGALAAAALLGGLVLYWQSLQSTIGEGERLQATWTRIEEDVKLATARAEKLKRLEQGVQTLEGWSASRYDWPAFLTYVARRTPPPGENIQFTRLAFDEIMVGLRRQKPAKTAASFHPVRRSVDVVLRGLVASDQPEVFLARFQERLLNGPDQPVGVLAVNLDDYFQLRDPEGTLSNRTRFTFTVRLEERELKP